MKFLLCIKKPNKKLKFPHLANSGYSEAIKESGQVQSDFLLQFISVVH